MVLIVGMSDKIVEDIFSHKNGKLMENKKQVIASGIKQYMERRT